MKKIIVYMVYVISILVITSFLSIQILEGRIRIFSSIVKRNGVLGGMFFLNQSEPNLNCPCEEIGKESGCKVRFMRESDNPALDIELVPGHEQIFDGFGLCIPPTTVKINSYGFRDYEYSEKKPDGVFRIVVVGDSITFGQGVELNQSYTKVLEKLLNEKTIGRNYEVLNFGAPGYNLAGKIEVLKSKAMRFSPDLIIFQYLGDDIVDWAEFREIEKIKLQEFAEKRGKSVKNLTDSERLDVHAKTYEQYLIELTNNRLDEVLEKIEQNFEKLNSITESVDVLLVADGLDAAQRSVLEKISKLYGWPLIDIGQILSKYPENKMIIHPKENHPTPFAHGVIAEEVYNKLLSSKLLTLE